MPDELKGSRLFWTWLRYQPLRLYQYVTLQIPQNWDYFRYRMDPEKRWTLVFSATIAFATIVYAIVAGAQLFVMRGQLREMTDMATRAQLPEIMADLSGAPPEPIQEMQFDVIFQNVGKGAAFGVSGVVAYGVCKVPSPVQFFSSLTSRQMVPRTNDLIREVFPGGPSFAVEGPYIPAIRAGARRRYSFPTKLNDPDFASLSKGEKGLCIVISLRLRDSLGEQHFPVQCTAYAQGFDNGWRFVPCTAPAW